MYDDLFDFDNPPAPPPEAPQGNPQGTPNGTPQGAPNGTPQVVPQTAPQAEIDYEKLSYGKLGYKRVQRLRRKGKRRGIKVPQLGFELTKPEKPRAVFVIMGIVDLIIFGALAVGIGFLIKYSVDFFSVQFKETGGLFKTLFNPAVFIGTAGLSTLPAILIIAAYAMLIGILLIPICFALYCISFLRNSFYMAKCSKEEFAKGGLVGEHIVRFVVVLAISTIALFVCLGMVKNSMAMTIIGLLYVGIVLIFGTLLVLILKEKSKCRKWFDSLDEAKKQNYLEHERALKRVKRRLSREKESWSNFI